MLDLTGSKTVPMSNIPSYKDMAMLTLTMSSVMLMSSLPDYKPNLSILTCHKVGLCCHS